jgi:hypothetical protein
MVAGSSNCQGGILALGRQPGERFYLLRLPIFSRPKRAGPAILASKTIQSRWAKWDHWAGLFRLARSRRTTSNPRREEPRVRRRGGKRMPLDEHWSGPYQLRRQAPEKNDMRTP